MGKTLDRAEGDMEAPERWLSRCRREERTHASFEAGYCGWRIDETSQYSNASPESRESKVLKLYVTIDDSCCERIILNT